MSAFEILTEVDAVLGRPDTYPLDAIPGFVRDMRDLIDLYRELAEAVEVVFFTDDDAQTAEDRVRDILARVAELESQRP